MSPFRRGIGALCALLFVLLGAPQGVLVVCVADDGHLALEMPGAHDGARACAAAVADCATGAGAAAASLRDVPCACGDDCGTCSDSELGLVNGLRAASQQRFDATPLSPVVVAVPVAGLSPAAAAAEYARLRAGSPDPCAFMRQQLQQGTVLRI